MGRSFFMRSTFLEMNDNYVLSQRKIHMQVPTCRDCQIEMEIGHFLDSGHYNQLKLFRWFPGTLITKKTFLGPVIQAAKRNLPVQAYRCPKCSQLQLYAPPAT